jgi:NADH:ubiquinone oxidoreductase subunit E
MNARATEARAKELLGVDFGATTADGRVTLEAVYCLGNCACAPAIMVNGELHGRVTPERFDELASEWGRDHERGHRLRAGGRRSLVAGSGSRGR